MSAMKDKCILRLEKKIEFMKCCGNCYYYSSCNYDSDKCNNGKNKMLTVGDNNCYNWKSEIL